MEALNNWFKTTLGEWTIAYPALYLIAAAALLVIFIITIICVAVCHGKNKKKIAELQKQKSAPTLSDRIAEEKLREQIRAELESEAGAGADKAVAANKDAPADTEGLEKRITELEKEIAELKKTLDGKQAELDDRIADIAELRKKLASASASDGTGSAKLKKLETQIKEKENEINRLKAENAEIKARALQQQLAATSAEQPKKAADAKKQETAAAAAQSDDDDDEYDEYYDDYGDENSAIKVTLKFDRLKNNWIILRSDSDRTYRRLATKQEALVVAKDLAKRLHAQLAVHKKDGKFQKV